MFVDPALGDFRVRDGSPALKSGFTNFPMDRFGVKKPSLQAIARTPVIPSLREATPIEKPEVPLFWLGAPVHSLVDGEFSAFGTRKENGGVQPVTVPAGSADERFGFQANDLVQQVDGKKVATADDRHRRLKEPTAVPKKITLIRSQNPITLNLTDGPWPVTAGSPATPAGLCGSLTPALGATPLRERGEG